MGLDTKAYWLTDRQSQCNFDFDFDFDFEAGSSWKYKDGRVQKSTRTRMEHVLLICELGRLAIAL
jgi:hypothetical protein